MSSTHITGGQLRPPEIIAIVGSANSGTVNVIAPYNLIPADTTLPPGLDRLKSSDQEDVMHWAGQIRNNLQGSRPPAIKFASQLATSPDWALAQEFGSTRFSPVLAFSHFRENLFSQFGVVWNEGRIDQSEGLDAKHLMAVGSLMLAQVRRLDLNRTIYVRGYRQDTRSRTDFFENCAGMKPADGQWGRRGARLSGVAGEVALQLEQTLGIRVIYTKPKPQV